VSLAIRILNQRVLPALTALSDNTHLSAIRAGMVSVVPLTIIGGLFTIVAYLPVRGWDEWVKSHLPLLQVPVTATFGLLGVFVCIAVSYDLRKRLKQEAIVSASMATAIFLMLQIQLKDQTFSMEGLASKGIFTALVVALVTVCVQRWFTETGVVIRLPANVPPVVYESFLSLIPMCFLVLVFWVIRFVLGWDINHKPFVNVPWTTPPILGHYLVSGGDWRAAIWGAVLIVIAMLVYLPLARAAERQRLQAETAGTAHE